MRETMKATSSSSSFAVYITLCITAVVHISYGDSRETCQPCPVTTTPPIDHVLPLEPEAANHNDLICPASEKCACGRKNSSESISPWIFVILDSPNLPCIGTLISPHVVLTSAYCVCSSTERSVRSPETLKVIEGNQWFYGKSEGATVRVRHISVHPLYFGVSTNFAADVALIDLDSNVPFTPACVDWDLEFDIAQRELANITISDYRTLQEVVVQCESYVNCVSATPEISRDYLTHDKFCVKLVNDTGAAAFTSTGLVVQRNGVSFVKGVGSGLFYYSNVGSIHRFTNLSDVGLIHWLRQTKLSFDATHIDN